MKPIKINIIIIKLIIGIVKRNKVRAIIKFINAPIKSIKGIIKNIDTMNSISNPFPNEFRPRRKLLAGEIFIGGGMFCGNGLRFIVII
jgi:hypothetical protein